MKLFFKKYHVPLLLLLGIISLASFMVQLTENYHQKRVKYIQEHPETQWKDGEMITVYKNDEAVLTTPCGQCVFANTDSKNTMSIEWSKSCGFGQADEVTTIPMETGKIYRAKRSPCKIKP